MKKIIEIMVYMGIRSEFILEAVCASNYAKKIKQNNSTKHPKEKKNIFYLAHEIAQNEGKFMYFLYCYFSYECESVMAKV